MAKIVNTSGKRKTAIARATLSQATHRQDQLGSPRHLPKRDGAAEDIRTSPPAPEPIEGIDVAIDVHAADHGQAEAVRTALARGILKWHNDPQIKDVYISYDRSLLVNDSRRKNRRNPWTGCKEEIPKVLSFNLPNKVGDRTVMIPVRVLPVGK